MILHYSSNNYSYKLGDSGGYIRKNEKGFYIDSLKAPKYFDNFIFTSQNRDYYLITTSKNEFVVYKITDKIEKAVILYNSSKLSFEHITLKLDSKYIKISSNLTVEEILPDSITISHVKFPSKGQVSLEASEITVICNIPILYSITANIYYPYDGNSLKEFFFQ